MAELRSLVKRTLGARGVSRAAAVRTRLRALRWYSHVKAGHLGTGPLPRHRHAIDLADSAALVRVKDLDWAVLGAGEAPEKDVRGIPEHMLEVLIACEQHAVPTVLVIEGQDDLDSPVAAVVTHLATRDESLYEELRRRVGSQRAVLLPNLRNSRPRREADLLRKRLKCSAR